MAGLAFASLTSDGAKLVYSMLGVPGLGVMEMAFYVVSIVLAFWTMVIWMVLPVFVYLHLRSMVREQKRTNTLLEAVAQNQKQNG